MPQRFASLLEIAAAPDISEAYTSEEDTPLSFSGYQYLNYVRDIPILVGRARQKSNGSSTGSSSSISSMASMSFYPHITYSCSTALEREAPPLRELVCRMVSDGFPQALIGAFQDIQSSDAEAGALEQWFSELDVHEALRDNVRINGLPDADDDLVLQCSLWSWTRALTLMAEALSATQRHLRDNDDPDHGLGLVRFAEASMFKMLAFADALVAAEQVSCRSITDKLWSLLCLHIHISKASETLMPSLLEVSRSLPPFTERKLLVNNILTKMEKDFSATEDKMGKAMWTLMQDAKSFFFASEDSSGNILPPQDEEIHETTELTLEYLTMLWANDTVLNSIIWRFSDSWHHTTTTNMIADMIRDLEHHLEEESKSLQNNSQRYMFLLNNFDFIEEKLNEIHIAPRHMFGKDQNVKSYMRRYLDVSWEPVLSCLQSDDGGTTTSCLFPSKQCFSLEKFQSMLKATCKAQMFWKVPNPNLRQRLRKAIIGKVIGPYNDYVEAYPELKKHYDDLPINCSSSSSERLNDMLNQLFEGV